jgi:peptidoglycan L-alanyl-D-glutamate endopeptidase CwlK
VDTQLDSLDPRFKPLAIQLLARCVEARIPVLIINTRRTDAEQAAAVASGHSWVTRSKHQDGLAIDIAPLDSYLLHGPDKIAWSDTPIWQRLGALGEALNLRWGGRWKVRDWGHFEYPG